LPQNAFLLPVAFYTLGCKLNQIESESLAAAFAKSGFPVLAGAKAVGEKPLLAIVNTCTVTSKSDQKARGIIRRLLRENPGCCIMVTGCYAFLDPDEIRNLENPDNIDNENIDNDTIDDAGIDAVSGFRRLFVPPQNGQGAGSAKSALLDLPEYLALALAQGQSLSQALGLWTATPDTANANDPFGFNPEDFSFHSRGYLKVQDGCDNACTYCRVRLARGPSLSLSPQSCLERLLSLEKAGYAELMLNGVNLGQYRHSGFDLAGLIGFLLEGSSTIALRLSSINPESVTESLAAVLAHKRIRPHFHLSVQSGSDKVLGRMGRAYKSGGAAKAAALLRSAKENPFLACDIIAGFPGETEDDFGKTLELCRETGFAWIHAFPYSKRPGTQALSLDGSVNEGEAKRRVAVLSEFAVNGRRQYARSWIGKPVCAVVEKTETCEGQCRALSENYLKLTVNCKGNPPKPGSVITCIPKSLYSGGGAENPDALADMV
jgi:threonylcarbamoyladenosine tRNA methylthiotransferase MtaB